MTCSSDLKHSHQYIRTTAKELVVPRSARYMIRFDVLERAVCLYRAPSGECTCLYAKPANDGLFCVKDWTSQTTGIPSS